MTWLKKHKNGSIMFVHVVPGSSSETIAGLHGDALKIKLKAHAHEGKANRALIEFLAATLKIPRRDIQLLSGASSKRKKLFVSGVSVNEILNAV